VTIPERYMKNISLLDPRTSSERYWSGCCGRVPERLEASRRRECRRIGPTLAGFPTQEETSRVIPETRYARTPDGVYIAYQIAGEGPVDVAWQFDFVGNVDVAWESPIFGPGFGESRPSRG
jgi:hypothetical protein